jgi:hypothetical protein
MKIMMSNASRAQNRRHCWKRRTLIENNHSTILSPSANDGLKAIEISALYCTRTQSSEHLFQDNKEEEEAGPEGNLFIHISHNFILFWK